MKPIVNYSNLAVVTTETIAKPAEPSPSWQTTAYAEIRNGSWAVLLVCVVGYMALRGTVAKYLDGHMSLLATMKDSLSKNADSLENLAKAETVQNQALTRQGDNLEEQVKIVTQQQQSLMAIDARQKEVVSRSFQLLSDNTAKLDILHQSSTNDEQAHYKIIDQIVDLKTMSASNQKELIDKLQTIEDMYAAAEEVTGNKGIIKNFWGNHGNRK